MKIESIPLYIRCVYKYFGIPEVDWPSHYEVDLSAEDYMPIEVSQTYQLIYKELKHARRVR